MSIKKDSGLIFLSIRLVLGWTYFSAFYRRVILENKLDPEAAGYIGEKFNHFLPNALGIKPIILYLVENPDMLWINMVAFTVIEGIVGLALMFGFFTRLMSLGVFGLAMGILLGSGWIGTTCLDEWQIGILGLASGFALFISGSGAYSIDNYLIKNEYSFTKKKWFSWLASGTIPIKESIYKRVVLIGALFTFGMALMTNQVFHNGLWGNLHNKSVRPKLEISNTILSGDQLSFDVYRVEGVDVYGAWIIGIELIDNDGNVVSEYNQERLSQLNQNEIENYYVAKVKPGKHSLVIPLGAKAKLLLDDDQFAALPNGNYRIKITDISGLTWEESVEKL